MANDKQARRAARKAKESLQSKGDAQRRQADRVAHLRAVLPVITAELAKLKELSVKAMEPTASTEEIDAFHEQALVFERYLGELDSLGADTTAFREMADAVRTEVSAQLGYPPAH